MNRARALDSSRVAHGTLPRRLVSPMLLASAAGKQRQRASAAGNPPAPLAWLQRGQRPRGPRGSPWASTGGNAQHGVKGAAFV